MDKHSCTECQKYKDKLVEVLENSESIFDAVFDMSNFEEECQKTCPNRVNE